MKSKWPTKKLGDVCQTGSGGTPLKASKEYYENGKIPWLLSGEVGQGEIVSARNFITQKGLEDSAAKVFPNGTVLVAMYGATAGQVGILRFAAATNQAVCGILPNGSFVPEYLFYYLMSRKDELVSQAVGNAQPNISQIKIRNTDIPVAPRAEQQRIVGILDEALDGIATAKANAEGNLQNARALFESHLQSVFAQCDDRWVKLSDVCEVKDGTHDSPKYVTNGIPFVTQKNIQEKGLSFASTKFIEREDHDKFYRRSNVAYRDILISMIGANRGMACIVDDERVFSIKNVGLVKRNESLNQQFLLYFLKSAQAADYVRSGSKGGAQEFIGLTELRNFPVPFPDLKRQNAVAEQLKVLSVETRRLESIYQKKLGALEELKKSLLHQAFSGEL